MKLSNSKKGDANEMVLVTIRDLTIIIIVFLAIFSFISNVTEQRTFEKKFLAKDTALLINTIYAAPGNLEFVNPQNTVGFTLEFDMNKVEVYDLEGESKPQAYELGTYFFMYNPENGILRTTLSPLKEPVRKSTLKEKVLPKKYKKDAEDYYKIKFVKTGDKITLSRVENEIAKDQ